MHWRPRDVLAAPMVLEVWGLTLEERVRVVSFGIRPGEIVGLAGLTASDRTEIAEAAAEADGSEILIGPGADHVHGVPGEYRTTAEEVIGRTAKRFAESLWATSAIGVHGRSRQTMATGHEASPAERWPTCFCAPTLRRTGPLDPGLLSRIVRDLRPGGRAGPARLGPHGADRLRRPGWRRSRHLHRRRPDDVSLEALGAVLPSSPPHWPSQRRVPQVHRPRHVPQGARLPMAAARHRLLSPSS
jgi:hypothetical protein